MAQQHAMQRDPDNTPLITFLIPLSQHNTVFPSPVFKGILCVRHVSQIISPLNVSYFCKFCVFYCSNVVIQTFTAERNRIKQKSTQ